jgi:hypothetical protein
LTDLSAGASCSIAVRFCPVTAGAKSALIKIDSSASNTPSLSLALYSAEPAISQAQRRIAPVLSSIELRDSNGNVFDPLSTPLTPGEIYGLEFDILGYHTAYDAWVVLFKCEATDTGDCGVSFASGVTSITAKLNGAASPSSWSYDVDNESVDAQNFQYNTSICVVEAGNYVLRIFQRSENDSLAANFTLSLMMPGNLGLPSYSSDNSGRRLSLSASGASGVCPP